jgi:hypothetical protein
MASTDPTPGSGPFEVVVAGPVGPVVRSALDAGSAGSSGWSTVVRVPADDVTDVLRALHEHGLEVEEVVLAGDDPGADLIHRA